MRVSLVLSFAVGAAAFSPGARLPVQRAVSARPALVPASAYAVPLQSSFAPVAPRAGSIVLQELSKETSLRSAVKAIGWRFTAGIVTACTSYYYTGSLAMMYALVGWDLCSKSVTMFIGERIWNRFDWGKEKGADTSKRSLAKAIAWRIFAAANTFVGATLLSKGKVGAAGKIAGTDSVVKTVLFFFYERAWSQITWQKTAVESAAAEPAADAAPATE